MKRVLIIAYAFPPLSVAGTFRPLRFAKYLPKFGWSPTIITVKGRNDIPRDESLLKEVPKEITVFRARTFEPHTFGMLSQKDAAKKGSSMTNMPLPVLRICAHNKKKDISLKKAISFLNNVISIPDPSIYWVPSVILRGIMIHFDRPYQAIITTSPPHSSHLAGLCLSRLLKKPWIADFRDPWVDNVYFYRDKGGMRTSIEKWLEKLVVTNANVVVPNTSSNRKKLLTRYGSFLPRSKFVTITNGFDKKYIEAINYRPFDKFTICHTGTFYPVLEPYFFFEAFANWLNHHKNKKALRNSTQVLLVGSQNTEIKNFVHKLDLQDCVYFVPRVSHIEALSLAKAADLLLVNLGFKKEASGWIPLKIYDYLGCRCPILGLLPHAGAAANLIRSTNTGYVVSHPDHQAVCNILDKAYSEYKNQSNNTPFSPNETELNKYEIHTLTEKLAKLLDDSISRI